MHDTKDNQTSKVQFEQLSPETIKDALMFSHEGEMPVMRLIKCGESVFTSINRCDELTEESKDLFKELELLHSFYINLIIGGLSNE